MKFVSHVTLPNGVVHRVEVRAPDRQAASRAALIGMPRNSTASSRPVAHVQMALEALQRRISLATGEAIGSGA